MQPDLGTWVRRVLAGCIVRHEADPLYARDDRGRAYWECRRCGQPIPQRTERGSRVPFRTVGTRTLRLVKPTTPLVRVTAARRRTA